MKSIFTILPIICVVTVPIACGEIFDNGREDDLFEEGIRQFDELEVKPASPEPAKSDEKEVLSSMFGEFPVGTNENLTAADQKPVADETTVEEGGIEYWIRVVRDPNKERMFNKKLRSALIAKENGEKWPSDLPTPTEILDGQDERLRSAFIVGVSNRARETEVLKRDRKEYVELLTERLVDTANRVSKALARGLPDFKAEDYTDTAVENVRRWFDKSKGKTSILLMGKLDIDYAYENTKELLVNDEEGDEDGLPPKPLWMTSAWAPALVAARRGDKETIRRVLAAADERWALIPERGWPTQKTQLIFPQLEYVRQPEIVEYFKKHLFTSELFVGDHGKPNPYGYPISAARSLVRMLEGFPWPGNDWAGIPINEDRQQWIAKWREWMNAQTEWVFRKD